MAEAYSFTPAQVGEMTLYQIRTLIAPKGELGAGKYRIGLEEMRALRRRKQLAKEAIESGDKIR